MTKTLPQTSLDPLAALQYAAKFAARVVVFLRPERGRQGRPRVVQGVPTGFRPTADGRPRVVLQVDGEDLAQMVVVERIERVVFARDADEGRVG